MTAQGGTDTITAMEQSAFDRAARLAFADWFGLQPTTARVLVALYRAAGAPTTSTRLADIAAATARTVRTHHLKWLRQAMESEAIDREPGAGYLLTETGRAECLAVLWAMGEELRRAS